MFSLEDLNQKQQIAARTINGPLLILAGAGSGKTRTLTYRMASMVKEHRIDPKAILALTFTNKAALEMKKRVRQLLKGRKSPQTSTFHALCLQILKEEIHLLGYQKNFTLYDQNDQMSLMRDALNNFKSQKTFDRGTILSMMSSLKNKLISPEQYASSEHFDESNDYCYALEYCYYFYSEKMRYFNAIDFDDILGLTVQLFEKHPEVATKYSQKFEYVLVDEYQDTNPLQFSILQGLTSTHNNICVVGDDDQSIYKFRGADIENILNFENLYEGTKVVKLEENYRSTQNILNLSNEVIKKNTKRKAKTLWTHNEKGELPSLWETLDDVHEAQIVADEVVKLQERGVALSDIAILYRSNTQIPPFEDQLRMSLIPYKIIGGKKLYDRKEIKDLIAYVATITNPLDEISLRRVLNVPTRGIGNKTLEKYLEISKGNNKSLFASFNMFAYEQEDKHLIKFLELWQDLKVKSQELGPKAFMEYLIEKTQYIEFIKRFYKEEKQVEIRKNLINTLISSAERFEQQKEITPTLKNFFDKILLADSQDIAYEKGEEQGNVLTLMTLHSSKGLEFDYVFLVGTEEEFLPHKRTIKMGEDISEERRLFYVGITRARKHLYMTRCKQRRLYGKDVKRHVTRFLTGFEEYYSIQDRTTLNHLSEEEAEAYKTQLFSDLMNILD